MVGEVAENSYFYLARAVPGVGMGGLVWRVKAPMRASGTNFNLPPPGGRPGQFWNPAR
jgi:hypothetical protein